MKQITEILPENICFKLTVYVFLPTKNKKLDV